MVTFDPRIARDIPVGKVTGAADLGSVQPVQPRQHQRRDATSSTASSGTTLTTLTNFQQPTLSSGPRIMQLAVKLRF